MVGPIAYIAVVFGCKPCLIACSHCLAEPKVLHQLDMAFTAMPQYGPKDKAAKGKGPRAAPAHYRCRVQGLGLKVCN